MDTQTYYQIVLGFLGSTPNAYCSETFKTKEEAEAYFNKEYKSRNKGDRYDDYWNNMPMFIQKVTITTEVVADERTPEQKAETHVHKINDTWQYLINGNWSAAFDTKKDCVQSFIENELK